MKKESKVKSTQVEFNSMVGLICRNITFHDLENKVFVIGRERTKRQIKEIGDRVFLSGHSDIEKFENMRMDIVDIGDGMQSKSRHFPPSADDLKRDLEVLKELKKLAKLLGSLDEIEAKILKSIDDNNNNK